MYNILAHAHSGLRWLVLLFLILSIAQAFSRWRSNTWSPADPPRSTLLAFIFTHTQLLLGLVLYFISPKVQFSADTMSNALLRFYTVEHFSLMLLAVILITIGYGKAKRQRGMPAAHKTILIYYGIGLLLILVSIPWPFRGLGAGWF
jgi:hypothetical protein